VDALVRGLEKHGGRLVLGAHVKSVLRGADGSASGVELKNGAVVRARKGEGGCFHQAAELALLAHITQPFQPPICSLSNHQSVLFLPLSLILSGVVSNASIWDTAKMLPDDELLPSFKKKVTTSHPSDSFVHLHAVVNLPSALTAQLPVHTYFLNPDLVGETGWPTLTIATAVDDGLVDDRVSAGGGAASGGGGATAAAAARPSTHKHILHCYMAEPFEAWEGLDRGSERYEKLKDERAEVLWGLIEQVVPGARQCLEWQQVGTPLTHQRFRRRHRGAYGPASDLQAAAGSQQLEAVQPIPKMYCCGDCVFPYIGTPAVAAGGMWVANTFAPVWAHWAAANAVD
jgi:phytoene dehydrogenase-like protein